MSTAVSQVMSRKIVSVGMDDTLQSVRALLSDHHVHHILVTEGRKPLGIISDRDLLIAISPYLDTLAERPRDLATLNRRAHQIMTRRPVVIGPEDTVTQAASLMLEARVSALPVVDQNGDIVGIVTWRDVLRTVAGPS